MIFYTLQQWIAVWTELISWLKSEPLVLEESREGRVDAEIETGRVWRVRHLATFWSARSEKKAAFKDGDYVRVVKRKGLILFIEPIEPTQ